jgi:hypothetical protein
MALTDPVYAAIERHRLADAAYDDSLERGTDESVKETRNNQEAAALIALLRTRPETLPGCLAALRYVVDWAENTRSSHRFRLQVFVLGRCWPQSPPGSWHNRSERLEVERLRQGADRGQHMRPRPGQRLGPTVRHA